MASEVGVVLRGGVAGGGCGVTSGISSVASVSSVSDCDPLVLPLPITSYHDYHHLDLVEWSAHRPCY